MFLKGGESVNLTVDTEFFDETIIYLKFLKNLVKWVKNGYPQKIRYILPNLDLWSWYNNVKGN